MGRVEMIREFIRVLQPFHRQADSLFHRHAKLFPDF